MRVLATVLALLLPGCGAPRCQIGEGDPMRVFSLYFGRSVTGRAEVSEREWDDFRDRVITTALPDGYTVLDGRGAWKKPRAEATITEATKILVVALPDKAESVGIVNGIRNAWRRQYHQYAVGMTVQTGCGSFSAAEASQ